MPNNHSSRYTERHRAQTALERERGEREREREREREKEERKKERKKESMFYSHNVMLYQNSAFKHI